MRHSRIALAALSLVLGTSPTLAATTVATPGTGARALQVAYYGPLGQSFVADAANLISFGFQFEQFNAGQPNSPLTITVRSGAGTDGSVVATRTVTLPTIAAGRTGTWYDFDLTGTTLATGATYTALVSTSSSLLGLVYGPDLNIFTGQPLGGDAYAAGSIISTRALDTYCITSGACDTNFRFTTQAAAGAVPEPASWAMAVLGAGLVGAAVRRRRVRLVA